MERLLSPSVSFMRTALFLKTYVGDREWLPFCLRSIQKFCSGYSGVHVVSEDVNWCRPVVEEFGFTFHPAERPDYPGYLQQQVCKLHADEFLDDSDTHIVFTDSDTLFAEPNTPETWCVNGKPRLVYNTFEFLNRGGIAVPWQKPTERVLRFPCPYETMRCQPLIYARVTVKGCRDYFVARHKVSYADYCRRLRTAWGAFSEFNILGNYAIRYHRSLYHFIDFDRGYYKIPQGRQYGFRKKEGNRVTRERREYFEELLA